MRRSYDMSGRAAKAAETRRTMLESVIELVGEIPLVAVVLPVVADRAGVTTRTVLRAFGSRDGMFEAAVEFGRDQILAERTADPDDVEASLTALIDHYERVGDMVVLLLAQESWEPLAAAITDSGKAEHRRWIELVFAHRLRDADEAGRTELTDLLVVATDVSAWKLLRRDRGLDRVQTQSRIRHMVLALLR